MTNPPELAALAEATDRAQAFLAEIRHNLPGAPSGVVCMILLAEADDARHLGEDQYAYATVALATRLANQWRTHTMATQN